MLIHVFITVITQNVKAENNASNLVQTIRGKIIDQESKMPLPGAHIIILNTKPTKGTASDAEGNFILKNIKIGRISLYISCMGYEPKNISNLELGSAKELIVNITLSEAINKINEIKVKPKTIKHETINKMSVVSGQAFTVEETSRFAGALNDPARMVLSYAGIGNNGEGSNEIIVRGNSPRGIQWRLEGIEIPNPNHFADDGDTGGAVNALNSKMLRNSDFFTGAFTAEYGNAYSGIFDINLRNGNNHKREETFSFSTLGIDLTLEGPFSKKYNGSYLINYRYSSLQMLNDAGVVDFNGIPKYQDASFKINLPTQKMGRFQLFGLWGKNSMLHEEKNKEETVVLKRNNIKGGLAVFGLANTVNIGEKTYWKNTLAWTQSTAKRNSTLRDVNQKMFPYEKSDYKQENFKFSSKINTKINAKNSLKIGAEIHQISFDVLNSNDHTNTGSEYITHNANESEMFYQSFFNWKHRFNSNFTFVGGIHSSYFALNDDYSIEPRLGLQYKITPKQSISLGFGIHSKLESLSTYYVNTKNNDGNAMPNRNLEMSKANHYVIAYRNQLNANLHLKIEAYYQYLYHMAVENNSNSSVVLQDLPEGICEYDFVNKGSGKNYGVELSLERFLHKGYYYLLTASLFNAKLKALNGVERNSRFNSKYMFNLLFGKEFKVGKDKRNIFSINTKLSYQGGQYFTPIDLKKSILEGTSVYNESKSFSERGENVFVLTNSLSYKINRKKAQHEFKLELKNMTGNRAKLFERYNEATREIDYAKQLGFLPNIYYVIYF